MLDTMVVPLLFPEMGFARLSNQIMVATSIEIMKASDAIINRPFVILIWLIF